MLADNEKSQQAATEEPERVKMIRAAIESVRPNLQRDGGDCVLLSVEGNKVMVRLTGACVFCKLAGMTLEGIQSRIVERLGELVRVIPVPGGGGPSPIPLQGVKPVRPAPVSSPE